jgi:hypothetical protein
MSLNVVVLPVVAPVVSRILKGGGWTQGSHAAIGQVTGCQGPDFIAKTILTFYLALKGTVA